MRGCAVYHCSKSERWFWLEATGAAPGALSRGKNASVDAAPPRNRTVRTMASGLEKRTLRSCETRRGREFMGTDVAAPDTRNSPITAAYVITHRIHTIFSSTK